MSKQLGRQRVPGLRWAIVGLAAVGNGINSIDRANLSVAVPFIQSQLKLSLGEMGLILGAFFWTYAGFYVIWGYFVDRWGPRIMFGIAAAWWSLFTALTGLGMGFASLFIYRFGLGAGEAGAYPSCAKAVSQWFPKKERAFANSIYDSGSRLGGVVALPIVALIIASLGWRQSFFITASFGIAFTVAWIAFYRNPRAHRLLSKRELTYIESGDARTVETDELARTANIRWIDLFRYRSVWGMMLGFFSINFVVYFFLTWFPSYLVDVRHFSLLKLGLLGTLPSLMALVGNWLGGLTSDYLVRRGVSLNVARKSCIVAGMLVSAVIVFAVFAPSAGVALALLTVSYGSAAFAISNVLTLPADMAPTSRQVGAILGIQNGAAQIAGLITATYTGFVLSISGGSYLIPLATASAFAIIGALSYLFLVGPVRQLPVKVSGPPGGTTIQAGTNSA